MDRMVIGVRVEMTDVYVMLISCEYGRWHLCGGFTDKYLREGKLTREKEGERERNLRVHLIF